MLRLGVGVSRREIKSIHIKAIAPQKPGRDSNQIGLQGCGMMAQVVIDEAGDYPAIRRYLIPRCEEEPPLEVIRTL